MKKQLSLVVLIFLLTGCNSYSTFSEINISQVNDHVREFIEVVEMENGYYLYLDGENEMYVFLNGIYVKYGNDAVYFSDFNVSAQQGILNMFINQESDSDYSNTNLNYQALFKINTVEIYETINLFINGMPISFDAIYGNE